MDQENYPQAQEIPFYVKDCALIEIATGQKALSLVEFRDKLMEIHPGSIYHHFWGKRISHYLEHREYQNDFAVWANKCLHDSILAERLGIIDPTGFESLELLRVELVEIVDIRLDEREIIPWVRPDEPFYFIRSNIVVFNTSHCVEKPKDLISVIPKLSESSIFYHFVDARRRTEGGINDFSAWLRQLSPEYHPLAEEIRKIDPYFISLSKLQQRLTSLVSEYFKGKLDGTSSVV